MRSHLRKCAAYANEPRSKTQTKSPGSYDGVFASPTDQYSSTMALLSGLEWLGAERSAPENKGKQNSSATEAAESESDNAICGQA